MIGLSITLAAIAVCYIIYRWLNDRLFNASVMTGSTILACLFLLMLIGFRRRLPILPLGSVSTWTQVHIYVGIFCSAVYIMHVPAFVAGGVFECGLSLLFLLVSASGFYGLYASRTLPRRLTAVEGQHRFDQMGWHRCQIAETAASTLSADESMIAGDVLPLFYKTYLTSFFGRRPSISYVLFPNGIRRRRLLGDLKELDRYLEDDGRRTAGKLAALIRQRDDLDYQFALQLRLRLWLVIHGVFSVALIAASVVHAVMAFRFIQ
ncbi:hypothetical protein Pla52n_02460 [Stieleria varia]|uniref:Ferric reductase like transmembrane component n=1 Tax=Stieleria varia TaxID=2528005 RepID=A0A5C6B6I5_9BACT|nr:hypothetical protein Pla52n_02460 [Stieleria varia]